MSGHSFFFFNGFQVIVEEETFKNIFRPVEIKLVSVPER